MHHIANGITTPGDATYNGLADAVADEGYSLRAALTQTRGLDQFAKKQKQAIGVYTAIAKRVARVAKAATAKLEILAEAKLKRS